MVYTHQILLSSGRGSLERMNNARAFSPKISKKDFVKTNKIMSIIRNYWSKVIAKYDIYTHYDYNLWSDIVHLIEIRPVVFGRKTGHRVESVLHQRLSTSLPLRPFLGPVDIVGSTNNASSNWYQNSSSNRLDTKRTNKNASITEGV